MFEDSYFVKIATPLDILAVRHFREAQFQNINEIMLLNFNNQHDQYIIKGLCANDIIYVHGRLKEINDIKSMVGGTLEICEDSTISIDIRISELKRIKNEFRHYNEITVTGNLKRK